MPFKDPAKRKAYQQAYSKKHYAANKEYYKVKKLKSKESLMSWFRELKSKLYCLNCGEDDAVVLDFHHRKSSEKEFSICDGLRRYARQRIVDEIAKCDVLCANCHRRHHHG